MRRTSLVPWRGSEPFRSGGGVHVQKAPTAAKPRTADGGDGRREDGASARSANKRAAHRIRVATDLDAVARDFMLKPLPSAPAAVHSSRRATPVRHGAMLRQ